MGSERSYSIQGREVRLPVEVRDARSAAATFLVDARAARRLLPGDELEIAEVWPGKGLASLALIDYRDNDLGDYHEVSIALFVRPRTEPRGVPYLGAILAMFRGQLGTYIHRLPVSQGFTREAGEVIWGFPKTLEQIELTYSDTHMRGRLVCDGRLAFELVLPSGGTRSLPESTLVTYSWIQGVVHATRFVQRMDDFGMRLGGAKLVLGDHPIADELRSLGLPRRALMCAWIGRMRARFGPPEKLPS